MDLVLRLTDSDGHELPDDHTWMIVEKDDGRMLVVVDRHITDEHLCAMWGIINPPPERAQSKSA